MCLFSRFDQITGLRTTPSSDSAEQRLRMCRDGRVLGSKLVSFAKGFSKHQHVLAIFKVDSKYLRFPFKVKVDYFILHSILVYSFVILLVRFAMTKRRRTNEASLLNQYRLQKDFLNILTFCRLLRWFSKYLRFPFNVKVDYFILHSILVYSFVILLVFFAMTKRRRTNEASLLNQYRLQKDFLNILITFCRLLRWFSKYLRFPFKVQVDYFILHSILFSSFVIFLIFFAMSRKKMHVRSRTDSDSNVYMFKRKQK